MKSTILLFGKNGQVGSELATLLPQLGEVVALGRQELDLLNGGDLRRTVRQIRPHLIVNAAAYTAVDQAEKDEATAQAINCEAPAIMAEEGKKIGASLVHYSTDYVFDGTKNTPYVEDDAPNPLNVYGKTKLAGEEAIRSTGISHLIFRTAWVYGTQGRNFLITILRLATQRDELRVVRDQFGAPARNVEIARATTEVLRHIAKRRQGPFGISDVSGTYHMTAAGITTWYDFAKAILEEASVAQKNLPWLACAFGGLPLRVSQIVPITTEEYPTPTHRPAYSVLSNALLSRTFGVEVPDWRIQLHRTFGSESFVAR